ncbi:MAG: MMPL family transporter [Planctomycetes bacterium]|nr:MMPL family transporter [Planctomycetota bacterium]
MGWLYRYSIRRPWLVIVAATVISLAVMPGALRLKIRTDGHALVPPDAPEIRIDREIRDQFATEDTMVVLITVPQGESIFNRDTLALVKELTKEIKALEGVRATDVVSLATEHGHRVWPGTINARKFLDPLPATEEELTRLREDLRIIRLYTGTVISKDERSASILVGVPHGMDRTEMYHRVRALVAAKGDRPEEIQVIGAPVAEALLGTHLLEDLGVPDVVLGKSPDQARDFAWPESLGDLRVLIAGHVGLVPVAIGIMGLVFLVSFRCIPGVALPLMEVGACLAFVFGLMGWLEVPVYLTIAVMPIILTAIGIADEIHIITRYRDHLRAQRFQSNTETVTATMEEMARPVVKTSVTTAIGFLSFALSPIGPVQAFGVFTAVGIVFCMFWSLSVTPAMLTLMSPRRWHKPRTSDAGASMGNRRSAFELVATMVVKCRYAVLVGAVVVLILAPLGVRQIRVQDSWINGFSRDSAFYRATDYFNRQFLGMHILLLRLNTGYESHEGTIPFSNLQIAEVTLPGDLDGIDDPAELIGRHVRIAPNNPPKEPTPPRPGRRRSEWNAWIESARREGDTIVIKGRRQDGAPKFALRGASGNLATFKIEKSPLLSPETLRRIDALETFIEDHREQTVGGVIGTADYIATTNLMVRGLREEARVIPDKPYQVDNLWRHYLRTRGIDRRRQLVDDNYGQSLVTVFMKNANFIDTQDLMDDIRKYEAEHLAPHGISIDFGGDVAVSQTLIRAIVSTQVRSLLLSLIGILVVTTIMGRSLLWGMLCVLPCGFAVLVNFAAMGWFGVPLGVATSMFAGMTLGIGVDYAIHLLERFRRARESGLDTEAALTDAVVATGPAIFIDAIAVALGFGVLTLSQVPANARLGGLVVLSILGCFAATFLLLPALLSVFGRRADHAAPPSLEAIPAGS